MILAHSLEMHHQRGAHFTLDLCERVPNGDTAWDIRSIGAIPRVALLNADEVAIQ